MRPPQRAPKSSGPDPRIAQLAAHERAQTELTKDWERKVAALARRHDESLAAARELEARIQQRQQVVESLTQKLSGTERQQQAAHKEAEDVKWELAQLSTRREALQAEIDSVSVRLEEAMDKQKTVASTKYTFVPFDALSGTTRRPIVIECRADRLTFVSEGISLTPGDLNGFFPSHNPLRAAVQALCNIWQKRDAAEREPYVLFIVRPNGTVTYYIARTFLEPMGTGFGYELVPESRELVWPQSDAELVRACRQAIDDARTGRRRSLPRSGAGQEEAVTLRVGTKGEFQLDEIERLREPAQTVNFGGQQIHRGDYTARRPAMSGAGAEPESRWNPFKRLGGGKGDMPDPDTVFASQDDNRTAGETGRRMPSPPSAVPAGRPQPSTAQPLTATASTERASESTSVQPATSSTAADPLSGLDAEPASDDDNPFRMNNPAPAMPPGAGRSIPEVPSAPPGARRPLGLVPFGQGISYQKDIRIHVTATQFHVADHRPIAWSEGRLTKDQAARFSADLEKEVRNWGPAPRGFIYRPRLLFLVAPGAAPQYLQLKALAGEWGVEHDVRYGE